MAQQQKEERERYEKEKEERETVWKEMNERMKKLEDEAEEMNHDLADFVTEAKEFARTVQVCCCVVLVRGGCKQKRER